MLTPRLALFTPGKETRYPFYRSLHGPQGRCVLLCKISPPPGIRLPDLPDRSESLYVLRYPGAKGKVRPKTVQEGTEGE